VIRRGEFLVAQLSFGAPLVDLVVAFTDVFGAKLDRAALVREVVTELGKVSGVGGLNPRAVTLSVGGEALYASLHSAELTLPPGPQLLPGGQLTAIAQPWGVAIAAPAIAGAELPADVASPPPPLALLASSKLGERKDTVMRAFFDARLLPASVGPLPVPIQTAELAATMTQLDAEVVAVPGQAGALTSMIDQVLSTMSRQADQEYASRKAAPAVVELMAIVQYHQAKMMKEMFTPKVDGDRLRFSRSFPPGSMQAMMGVAVVGVAAAVAVPAYVAYQRRAAAAP
jgi:hypothetical protein